MCEPVDRVLADAVAALTSAIPAEAGTDRLRAILDAWSSAAAAPSRKSDSPRKEREDITATAALLVRLYGKSAAMQAARLTASANGELFARLVQREVERLLSS